MRGLGLKSMGFFFNFAVNIKYYYALAPCRIITSIVSDDTKTSITFVTHKSE